jgi:hypothetical protein
MDDLGFVETVDGLGQSIDAPMLVKGSLFTTSNSWTSIRPRPESM